MKASMKVIIGLLIGVALLMAGRQYLAPEPPIKIGVLHALTGTMSVSEKPLVDAVRLAVEEINAQGGLLGRPVEIVLADSKSDPAVAALEAERLILKEGVQVLFGCWTSSCRKAVKAAVEKYHNLLIYPVQYEGMEQSPNILYTGAAPNQQLIPGARWAIDQFGKRLYLLGSDYVFPHVANLILHDVAKATDSSIVAERYLPLGSSDVDGIIEEIRQKKPDVLLNTLNGDSNMHFFAALKKAGLSDLPLVSFSVPEDQMKASGGALLTNHYGVWSYFQSLPGENNRRFIAAYQSRFGVEHGTSDPIEASYLGVKLWAQAVITHGTTGMNHVEIDLMRQSIEGITGPFSVDPMTHHVWKMVRVGKVNSGGHFEQVYASNDTVRPVPWPDYRSREMWKTLLKGAGYVPQ